MPKRRRFLRTVFVGLVALGFAFGGYVLVRRAVAARYLANVVAAIDRDDPHWRIDDLERKRADVADADNFAVALKAMATKQVRPPRDLAMELSARTSRLKANLRLDADDVAAARTLLAVNAACVDDALALAKFPSGRHAISHAPDAVSTLLRHVDLITMANSFLVEPLGYVAIHENDKDRALAVFRAHLNMGRSLRDEPILISQLVRASYRRRAVRGLERLLGHGELTDEQLAGVQRELTAELADDLWAVALRGERAMADRFFNALRSGGISTSTAKAMVIQSYRPTPSEKAADWICDHLSVEVDASQALTLDLMTRLIELGKRPWPERMAVVDAVQAKWLAGPAPATWLAQIDMPRRLAFLHVDQVRMRAALAAAGVERFRLKNGRWPTTLAEVDAKVADDVFLGQPLQLKRLDDGVVIYSVGPNRRDDLGDLSDDDGTVTPQGDIGVRLWDVKARGQAAQP